MVFASRHSTQHYICFTFSTDITVNTQDFRVFRFYLISRDNITDKTCLNFENDLLEFFSVCFDFLVPLLSSLLPNIFYLGEKLQESLSFYPALCPQQHVHHSNPVAPLLFHQHLSLHPSLPLSVLLSSP